MENQQNIFYVKLNLSALANFNDSTHAHLDIVKASVVNKKEHQSFLIWVFTLAFLLFLFLYNCYNYLPVHNACLHKSYRISLYR